MGFGLPIAADDHLGQLQALNKPYPSPLPTKPDDNFPQLPDLTSLQEQQSGAVISAFFPAHPQLLRDAVDSK